MAPLDIQNLSSHVQLEILLRSLVTYQAIHTKSSCQ